MEPTRQSIWSAIKADANANSISINNNLFVSLLKGILHPGMQMLFFYRLERKVRKVKYIGRLIGRIIRSLSVILTSCHVSPEADIDPGISIPHATGIVIGKNVKIRRNACIYQQVTIGQKERKVEEYPTVEESAILYAGCKIYGNIKIGRGAVVGANAVVIKSVPDNSVAVGVPASVQ
jgi:serine O-acetyltransferase